MKEFQRKRKIKRFLYSWFSIFLLAVLVFFTAKGAWGVFKKERESRKELSLVSQEIADLESREVALRGDIERLRTPEGMDAEIRKQFQVAKPGERMVVVVEGGKNEKNEVLQTKSLISKFFDAFR